jgi:hypothetical protein
MRKMTWKKKLDELRSLTLANGKNAHRTAILLRELYNDKKWLKSECSDRLDKADETLAEFSGRFALGPNDMMRMIEYFPDVKDWEGGRLDRLRDESIKLFNRERTLKMQQNAVAKGKVVIARGGSKKPPGKGQAAAVAAGGEEQHPAKAEVLDTVAKLEAASSRIRELLEENAKLHAELSKALVRAETAELENAGLRLRMRRDEKQPPVAAAG